MMGRYVGRYPAMVAPIVGPDGRLKSLHRTYIADLAQCKKTMPVVDSISGAAVRLFEPGECLGVAEGIESAIAAHELFDVPVWSLLSTGGMKSFAPPAGVRHLTIFADNDDNFDGQCAAYSLAQRLTSTGIDVEVEVPPKAGCDWLNVLTAEGGKAP